MVKFQLTSKRKEILQSLEIKDPFLICRYYPYRYNHYSLEPLSFALHNQKVTIQGKIVDIVVEHYRPKKCKTTLTIKYLDDIVTVLLFNRFAWSRILKKDMHLVVQGKYNAFKNEIAASKFYVGSLDDGDKYEPVYHLPSNVKSQTFINFVKGMYDYFKTTDKMANQIPDYFLKKYRLISLKESLYNIHFPKNEEVLHQANRHLKYEEFLNFCTMVALKRKLFANVNKKINKYYDTDLLKKVINSLPFKLSDDQNQVLKEILNDLQSNVSMNRLLQGDVGSGKTIISLLTMVANYSCNYQSALMVPTDILARQHYKDFVTILSPFDIPVYLLVSEIKAKEKENVIQKLNENKPCMVIGTHAIIQENITFSNLGLAIIDEQHRFGVKQRLMLKQKGNNLDILYMSATPIPRTLASTYYLDMDVSTIQHYPNIERKVETKYVQKNTILSIKKYIDEYLNNDKDAKVYVVCPAIDSSNLDMKNVTNIYKETVNCFPDIECLFLHGKLKTAEKNDIMNRFAYGNARILVTTTVIEVGINVKEANMLVILNAERFGLAQIHQLRGRIGRYGKTGYCYLCCDNDDEDIKERLNFLTTHSDGFEISEYDLKRRGPGEMLGLKQSGLPEFSIANLVDDYNILKTASADANYILNHATDFKDYLTKINILLTQEQKYID